MNDQPNRQRVLVDRLLNEYKPHAQGTSVDTERIRAIIVEDADLVAQVFPVVVRWNAEHNAGYWGLLVVIAGIYEHLHRDDSLNALLKMAAQDAKVTLPSMRTFIPHQPAARAPKIIEMQMAEEDVKAGDAHRVLMTMRLERMPVEVRERVIGNCIVSFPTPGDPRPIQHMPQVRRFVADLHKRMRYFPLYLTFDREYKMHLVYFGCLADEDAIRVKGTDVALDLLHASYVRHVGESLAAIREACRPLSLAWQSSVRQILAVYDQPTRRRVFGNEWDV